MAKKKGPAAPRGAAQTSGNAATAEASVARGEELIDTDPHAALQCFEEVLRAYPTNQSALCNRGVVAAQLWEEASPIERRSLLQMACESFRQVFALDTSTRSESRYLSCLACGKLLLRAAGVIEEEMQTSVVPGSCTASPELVEALTEASRCFEEAFRLTKDWGHEAFDDECWGAWGEVLAHQMRVEIAVAELRLSRSNPTLTEGERCIVPSEMLSAFEGIVRLCEAAAEKFVQATQAEVADPDVMDGGSDARWLTLQVEHLLAFVEFVRKALSTPAIELPLEDWGSRAETAWREAVSLADASLQLLGAEASWEAFSLRGDVFTTAAELLGALSLRMVNPQLRLPDREASPPELSETWESVGMPGYAAGQLINAAGAATYAEAAYAEALNRGGQEALAAVSLSLGELRLGLARRLPPEGAPPEGRSEESCSEREVCLRAASEAFQRVTTLRGAGTDKNDMATAWYNLACIAGLKGNAEHAAQALRRCFKLAQPSSCVQQWAREAQEDKDLELVCSHPDVQQILAGR